MHLTLDAYFKKLQRHEGVPWIVLVDHWPPAWIRKIEKALRQGIRSSGLTSSRVPGITPTTTNQSKGNKVAAKFLAAVAPALRGVSITSCKGAGYPDLLLSDLGGKFTVCMELKATSDWNPQDSNRRVLLSSSQKMRRFIHKGIISAPPRHLLITVLFEKVRHTITGVRLDFLGPQTEVQIRLEASTSHKLLTNGSDRSVIIDQ